MATSAAREYPVSAETSAVHIPTPALGPSLGVAPSGTWIWTSQILMEILVDAEHVGAASNHRHGRLDRFLHDVAKLARV